ncbi:MAG: hypothetical protein ABH986_06660 [archaeon]
MDEKTKNLILIGVFLAIVIASLYLAYQNGAIGKAVVQGISR